MYKDCGKNLFNGGAFLKGFPFPPPFSLYLSLPLSFPLCLLFVCPPCLFRCFLGRSLCLDLLLLLNCNQLKINQLKCSEKQFIIEKQPKQLSGPAKESTGERQSGRERVSERQRQRRAEVELGQQSQLTSVAPASARCGQC